MRRPALAGFALLLLPLAGGAEEARGPGGPGARAAASPAPSRLKLGPYAAKAADDPRAILDEFRYQEHVEVRGKAMDSATLTAKLEWWMKDIDLTRGATPATMSAPSIQEMHDYRPHVTEGANLMPVMQWLAEKLGGKKKD
jgi:hypothetical protein